jgi:hypothetical protein
MINTKIHFGKGVGWSEIDCFLSDFGKALSILGMVET